MDRRTALKNISLGMGHVVATPILLQILASCTSKSNTATTLFFSKEEQHIVTNLVDFILPASDIVGAIDVNVPEFIDKVYSVAESDENKKLFKEGALEFEKRFRQTFDTQVLKGKKESFFMEFETLFKLDKQAVQQIFQKQNQSIHTIDNKEKSNYVLYKFILAVRYYTIFGYVNSQKIGKEVLSYDPVPGMYKGCVPLSEIGNTWSLK